MDSRVPMVAPALFVPERRQSQSTAEEKGEMTCSREAAALGLSLALLAAPMFANESDVPRGIPHLDHVFVIMMENHGYQQVIGNPNEPYLNSLITNKKVNLATNYFAVGHPSLTNYLEIRRPDQTSASCLAILPTGTALLHARPTL